FFFSNDPPTTAIYTLSLHDALPILKPLRRECRIASAEPVCSCALLCAILHTRSRVQRAPGIPCTLFMSRVTNAGTRAQRSAHERSEEHTSELQSRGHLVCRLLLEKK